MIVKVQVSLVSTSGAQRVLIYNSDRSVEWEGALSPEVERLMDGRPKAFFHAHVGWDGKLSLDRGARWQQW